MSPKEVNRILLVIGLGTYIFSCILFFTENIWKYAAVFGYFMAAFAIPLLLLILSSYIAVKKKENHYLLLTLGGLLGAILLGALWAWIASLVIGTWSNVVNNVFTLLIGGCVTCFFEANSKAGAEIEAGFRE